MGLRAEWNTQAQPGGPVPAGVTEGGAKTRREGGAGRSAQADRKFRLRFNGHRLARPAGHYSGGQRGGTTVVAKAFSRRWPAFQLPMSSGLCL